MRPMEKLWAFPIQSLTNRFNSKTGNQTQVNVGVSEAASPEPNGVKRQINIQTEVKRYKLATPTNQFSSQAAGIEFKQLPPPS